MAKYRARRRVKVATWVLGTLGVMAAREATAQVVSEAAVAPPLTEGAPAPAAPQSATPATESSPINAQVGTRLAIRVQNPNLDSRDELDDIGSDGEADVVFWGQIHPFVKWQAGFVGSYGLGTNTRADVLDLVAKVEIAEALNLWVGRMPVPSDRSSLSTVWAMPTWNSPGRYSAYPPVSTVGTTRPWPGPRYGSYSRGDGVTVWGQLHGGLLKYYAGAFDLDQPDKSPLYSARLSLSLLNPEPGYLSSSGYYGNKNVLALGVGAQHQTSGSLPASGLTVLATDFNEVNTDLLFEMNGGTAGVVDVEGSFAKVWADHDLASYQVMGLASYLVPIDVGIGRFQPLLRCQFAGSGKAADATSFTGVDAQLGYIVDGYHARLLAVYQYAKLQGRRENTILFGLQLLSHAK
jgi:hypothetical protein